MKILFLQKRILFPTDAGMKIRTLNVVRHLAQWHELTYLCNTSTDDAPFLDEMRRLGLRLESIPWNETRRGSARFYGELLGNLASPYPYNVSKDYDRLLQRRAVEILDEGGYELLVCDFVQMALNVVGLNVPAKVLFQHNVEAEIFRRMAAVGGLPRRLYLGHQFRKMQRFEAEAGRTFDRVIAVSERDRLAFEKNYGWRNVRSIDTAVDTEYFRPDDSTEVEGRCVFVGSLDWLPNEEGVRWFCERVWPRVRAERSDATFQIVGRNPPAALRRIATGDGIELVGRVPDVRPYLSQAQVVVVPLLTGGGTRLKIFEGMAMKRATVSTALGAEGLSIKPDEHLLIADEEAEFAASILALMNDQRKRDLIRNAAHDLVTQSFTAEAIARQFESICLEAVYDRSPESEVCKA